LSKVTGPGPLGGGSSSSPTMSQADLVSKVKSGTAGLCCAATGAIQSAPTAQSSPAKALIKGNLNIEFPFRSCLIVLACAGSTTRLKPRGSISRNIADNKLSQAADRAAADEPTGRAAAMANFALENFMAFAPDALSSVGGYPGDDYKGGLLFGKIDPAKRTQDFVAAAQWLKARPDCTGKIGATGFCFGGSMTNNLTVLLGSDMAAVAPFYGAAPKPEDVPKVKAAVLIHHGALDKALSEAYPAQEAELKKNKIRYEGHLYPDSVHGFFNDATPERYNQASAQQAWKRTIEWFNQYVRGA
jgi:dienelactone hydrolase